ncbi:MAG: hypothetical protein ABIL16_05380 [candidate division WOR-3 bacterium]
MKRLSLFALLVLVFANCMTVVVTGDARLASRGDFCYTKVSEKRYIYFLYGLVPLGDNSTETIVPRGKKIRIETKSTVTDYLLTLLANIIIPTTITFYTAEVYSCEER